MNNNLQLASAAFIVMHELIKIKEKKVDVKDAFGDLNFISVMKIEDLSC